MVSTNSDVDNDYLRQGLVPVASLGLSSALRFLCLDDGMLISIASALACCVVLYASVVSKLLPATGHPVLDAVRNDTYYCVLIPLLGIPLFLFSYLNWLSFKLFRHN